MKKINKNLLIRTAKKSDHRINMHATLIIKGGRLISRGYNHKDIHSEEAAIAGYFKPSDFSVRGAIAINFMIKRKSLKPGNSRPCLNCMNQLYLNGVKSVIYFDGSDFREELIAEALRNESER